MLQATCVPHPWFRIAVEALDMFLSIVGAEAGHMALRSLASGGVYICGGIFPKVGGCARGCGRRLEGRADGALVRCACASLGLI